MRINTAVIIPFRDRGIDPRRVANLAIVQAWWYAHGWGVQIVDDGLEGDAPFNRHRAYNRAVSRNPEAEVFVFTEADMLIHPEQIISARQQAYEKPGLVVPFTQYRYLSDAGTASIRDAYYDLSSEMVARWWERGVHERDSLWDFPAASTMDNGTSIGAVNVISRDALDITGGFTEATHGNWYDDRIIEEGFAYLTGRRTRFVPGPAVHLYHLPGTPRFQERSDHLTEEDRRATDSNKKLLHDLRRCVRLRHYNHVRELMEVRR